MAYGIVLALVFGYLLGSIPFGLLITRAAGLGDVRNIGSGNIGATNVLRTGNKALGRPRRLFRPSLSGLARFQGRQGGRHLSRRADCIGLAGGTDLRRRLAGRRFLVPLFLAGGADGSS